MKKITSILFAVFLLISCKENTTIGKYTKEALPENFNYEIIKDESDALLEKNQLTVVVSEKLTIGQIATIAEELYNSKDKRRRFYIWYMLKGAENGIAWATSYFDPELEISINGATVEEDIETGKLLEKMDTEISIDDPTIQETNDESSLSQEFDGKIIGKWDENEFSFTKLIIFEKNNKTFIKTIFKNGVILDDELIESKTQDGIRYDYKEAASNNNEYLILNDNGMLDIYDPIDGKYTSAKPIN
jgi:hypothetical protein